MGKKRTIYKKQEIPFFIGKLIAILQNSGTQQIIKWSASGSGFEILNESLLVKNLLPEHFKHHNLASFIRQLNLYGFHKLENTYEYYHEHFNRQDPEQLKLIKRIIKAKNKKGSNNKKKEKKNASPNSEELLQQLAQQNLTLKEENNNLVRSKAQNLRLLKKLRSCIKKSKKSFQNMFPNSDLSEKAFQVQSTKDQKNPCSDPYKIALYQEENASDIMNSYLS